jgi:hypothetical protein
VEPPAVRRLLHQVIETEDEEISCTECFDLVSQYVDREPAAPGNDAVFVRLRQHLRQCGVCREEYEILRDLVRLDDEGSPT